MKPFFSIIIPVYNVAPYLRECLDSVLAQTFNDWEAICVDDGSSDGSGVILDEYAAKDQRFKVIHQSNAGVSLARNRALELASGSWVVFLDSDDLLVRNALEVITHAISFHPESDMIRFGRRDFSHRMVIDGDIKDEIRFCLEDVSRGLTFEQYCVYFPQYAYNRKVIKGARFEKFIRGEDILFMGMCLDNSTFIVSTEEKLYLYRIRMGSALHSKMSYQALHDEVAYRLKWLSYMQSSKKSIDKRIIRVHELFTVELAPFLATQFSRDDFLRFYYAWCEMSLTVRAMKWFSPISNIIISICVSCRSQMIFRVLCVWKYRARNCVSKVLHCKK